VFDNSLFVYIEDQTIETEYLTGRSHVSMDLRVDGMVLDEQFVGSRFIEVRLRTEPSVAMQPSAPDLLGLCILVVCSEAYSWLTYACLKRGRPKVMGKETKFLTLTPDCGEALI